MENNKIRTLLYVNLFATVLLIVLVVLLLKWTIPSTRYENYEVRIDGSYKGVVGWVTDLPGDKIRIAYKTYGGEFVVCEFYEDRVTFQKPLQPSY